MVVCVSSIIEIRVIDPSPHCSEHISENLPKIMSSRLGGIYLAVGIVAIKILIKLFLTYSVRFFLDSNSSLQSHRYFLDDLVGRFFVLHAWTPLNWKCVLCNSNSAEEDAHHLSLDVRSLTSFGACFCNGQTWNRLTLPTDAPPSPPTHTQEWWQQWEMHSRERRETINHTSHVVYMVDLEREK
jgi:hypothetical protein